MSFTPEFYREIFLTYCEHFEARKKAGFTMPGSRAVEDAAYEMNVSIKDVCVALSLWEGK
jgi:hypothetical protein